MVLNLSDGAAYPSVIWIVKINTYYLQTYSTLEILNNTKHFHTSRLWTEVLENRELTRMVVFPGVMLTDPQGFQFYFL